MHTMVFTDLRLFNKKEEHKNVMCNKANFWRRVLFFFTFLCNDNI